LRRLGREQLRPVQQDQQAAAAGHHRGDRLAVPKPLLRDGLARGRVDLGEVEGGPAQQCGRLAGPGSDHHDRYVVHLEVGGIAEDNQQQDRQDDHHRHRPTVPSQLTELLDDHRPHAPQLPDSPTLRRQKSTAVEVNA
jgi:hypothetical protein